MRCSRRWRASSRSTSAVSPRREAAPIEANTATSSSTMAVSSTNAQSGNAAAPSNRRTVAPQF